MTHSPRRAVITSVGLLSAIGSDHSSFWQAVSNQTTGIHTVSSFDASALPCHIAGEIRDFDAKKIIASKDAKKALKVMARTVQLGLCASQKAMDDGGPKPGTYDPFRFGIEFGCVMVATEIDDLARGAKTSGNGEAKFVDLDIWGKTGLREVPPLWMLKYLPNMPACHTSIYFDAQGPNNTITSSDAAGLLALGEAYRILGRNLADLFLVGGCESKLNPVSFTRHNLFSPFTRNNANPTTAVRPFDAARDGTALGECGVALGLEDLEHAQKRGAKIYAELVGFASGFDHGKKGPVLATVIRNALKEAGITPADIDHVNAHAIGSPIMDAFEARAIAEVFGKSVPVYACAGLTGNTGAASGLLEMCVSLLALQHGHLPGTANHTSTAADCPIQVHVGGPKSITKPYICKISYTDMGQCAVAIIKQWKD